MLKRAKGLPFLCACALGLTLGACGRTRTPETSGNSAGSATVEPSGGKGSAGSGSAPETAGSAGVGVSAGTGSLCFDCTVGMATEGFISNGCEADLEANGCSVDGFLDPDCEAGTPPFTACLGGTDNDLLDVYAACFTDFQGAQAIVSCYADFMDDSDQLVDCNAARAACSRP